MQNKSNGSLTNFSSWQIIVVEVPLTEGFSAVSCCVELQYGLQLSRWNTVIVSLTIDSHICCSQFCSFHLLSLIALQAVEIQTCIFSGCSSGNGTLVSWLLNSIVAYAVNWQDHSLGKNLITLTCAPSLLHIFAHLIGFYATSSK